MDNPLGAINDISSEGEGGGGQKLLILLGKKPIKGEGGHKIQKMGRRRLWITPYHCTALHM